MWFTMLLMGFTVAVGYAALVSFIVSIVPCIVWPLLRLKRPKLDHWEDKAYAFMFAIGILWYLFVFFLDTREILTRKPITGSDIIVAIVAFFVSCYAIDRGMRWYENRKEAQAFTGISIY